MDALFAVGDGGHRECNNDDKTSGGVMDWIIDGSSPASVAHTLDQVERHLDRHAAVSTGVAEAARELRQVVEAHLHEAPLRLHLAWPRVSLRPVSDPAVRAGAVPLTERNALDDISGDEVGAVEIGVERRALRSFDDGPPTMPEEDIDLERDGTAAVVIALLAAAETHPALTPAQTASLAGTMLADATRTAPSSTADAASQFVEVHRALGGEAEVLHVDDRSFEVGITRHPLGPGVAGHPAVAHLSTGVAGRLGAKLDGTAVVAVEESRALGDDECRLRVVLGSERTDPRGELHRWPPAPTTVAGPAPRLDLSVSLPSESASVPVIRRLAAQALRVFGVHDEDIDDVQLAITEACANVIDHATESDSYEVRCELAADRCAITVLDRGDGFDAAAVPQELDVTAEDGRGLALMRALVDTIAFSSEPQEGAVVHMVKTLRYDAEHPLWQTPD